MLKNLATHSETILQQQTYGMEWLRVLQQEIDPEATITGGAVLSWFFKQTTLRANQDIDIYYRCN